MQKSSRRVPRASKFFYGNVLYSYVFESPQHEASFMSPFSRPDFWADS
jgi:hypothetical protein